MKNKTIAVILSAGLLSSPALASEINGSRITSAPGMPQSEWVSSSLYKSFICPEGFGREEGLDMNYTTTRADDTYFVSCYAREVIVSTVTSETPTATVTPPTNNLSPNPTPSPTVADTSTSTSQTTSSISETSTITTQPTTTDTSTSTSSVIGSPSWVSELKKLIELLLALLARMNG